jgi:carboxyl-terminal processing protease
MDQFKQFLTAQNILYTDQDINGVSDWIRANIKAEIFTVAFGQMKGIEVRADWDPMIQQALTYMPAATQLEQTALKADAQKQAALSKAPTN